ncbi:MAG: DMT family transporter [Pseudobutyrivibrio sp.]|nr:DMT family transporter [Pseudobutyrivibrio sp.]
MKLKTRNQILLLITAIVWGSGFVFQTVGGESFGAFAFNGIRNYVGSLVLLPLVLFRDNKGVSKAPKSREEKKLYWLGAAVCGTFLFLGSSLQQIAINMGADVGKAGFITSCYILLVPILGIFIKRKCGVNVWIAVAISLVGLYLLCMKGEFKLQSVDVILLACALAFSIQIMSIDHFIVRLDGVRLACMQFFVVGIISTVPALVFDIGVFSGTAGTWIATVSNGAAIGSLLFAGLFATGVGYTLQMVGQEDVNPTVASLLMSLEAVFGVIFAFIFLHQVMTSREMLGCAIMFAAIVVAQLPDIRIKKAHNE